MNEPRQSPRRAVRVLALLVATAILLVATAASATVTLAQIAVGRPTAADVAPNRNTTAQAYMSYLDCIGGQYQLQFSVQASGITPTTYQVWASEAADCTYEANRDGVSCIELPSNGATFSFGAPETLTATQLLAAVPAIHPTTCVDSANLSAGHALTLYFLAPDGVDPVEQANLATWQTTIDVVGPAVATGIGLTAGDGYVVLNVPAASDPTAVGYFVYCSPPIDDAGGAFDAAEGIVDAGSDGDGGAVGASASDAGSTVVSDGGAAGGAGGSDVGGCREEIGGLAPGVVPPPNAPYCLNLGANAASVPLGSAINGTPYVVAVAAYDDVNNIGPLSASVCATPEPTDTFFSVYCREGGCPSSCSVGSSSELSWPALAAASLAAAMLAVRGARRRAT